VHGRFQVGEDLTREALAALARLSEQVERQGELLRRQEQRLTRLERGRWSAGPGAQARRGLRRLKAALTR
jgi:hypothetical protein